MVHLNKGFPGLLKETLDEGLAKVAFILVLVHLENLGEGRHVDAVQVRHTEGTFVGLLVARKR